MSNYNEEKYVIVNGVAYNEDKIQVYNIFIRNLPKNANRQNVLAYFSKFGEVLNVGFLRNGKGNDRRCYVNFSDPKAAAKALTMANPFFLGRNIAVKASQSWYQPTGRLFIQQLNGYFKNDSIVDTSCSSTSKTDDNLPAFILLLNDDCLEHICKKLPVTDQINFALTCPRFCEIFKMLSKAKYVNFDTDMFSSLTQFKTKIFLQIVGPQIKNLRIDFTCGLYSYTSELTFVKFLGSFCSNVESLAIEASTLHNSKIRTLIEKMPLLKRLELNDMEIDVALIKLLKTLKFLKRLDITDNNEIKGKNIHLLTGLESLSLYDCQNITSFHFKKICQNLKNLHYLDIRSCFLLKTQNFEQILEHLQQLQTLKFTTSRENTNSLAQLPKLKRLEVNDCDGYGLTTEFFQLLVKHQSEQLEELKLMNAFFFDAAKGSLVAKLRKLKYFYCDSDVIDAETLEKFCELSELEKLELIKCNAISDNSVLQLLESCHKLSFINLTFCNCLTPNIIRSAYKLLREQQARSIHLPTVNLMLSYSDSLQTVVDEIGLGGSTDVLKVTLQKVLNPEDFFQFSNYDDFDVEHYDSSYDGYFSDDFSDEDFNDDLFPW